MMRFRALLLAAVFLVTAPAPPAQAVLPDEVLDNPVLERRARALSRDLRCVVCQNESIDDSNAELARDMRLIVRARLVAGDSDEEVMQFMVDRYGDYVLLRPPVKATTYALWGGPLFFALVAGLLGWRYYRARSVSAAAADPTSDAHAQAAPSLSPEERARLDSLLKDEEPSP